MKRFKNQQKIQATRKPTPETPTEVWFGSQETVAQPAPMMLRKKAAARWGQRARVSTRSTQVPQCADIKDEVDQITVEKSRGKKAASSLPLHSGA